MTAYRVSLDSGIDRALYSKIESGKRPATDDVLQKLAPVLDEDFDKLKAWADLDRLGAEGIERIKTHAADLIGFGPGDDSTIVFGELKLSPSSFGPVLERLGPWLRGVREAKGLSADEVAKAAKIPLRNYHQIEAGKAIPSEDQIKQLARSPLAVDANEFSVRVDLELLGEDGVERLKAHPEVLGLKQRDRLRFIVLEGRRGEFPMTPDEAALLREAEQVGVWLSAIDDPDLWNEPAEDRAEVFEVLKEIISEGREINKRLKRNKSSDSGK
jgi:transcriptional regulator with XRE-family HTH domain